MAQGHSKRRPKFFWQGLAIVLPVAVLVAFGVASLRQDQVLAQHEAAERAQGIADSLVQTIWTDLTARREPAGRGPRGFQVDSSGRLVYPPPCAPAPIPKPLDAGLLSPKQAGLWRVAQVAEARGVDRAQALLAWRDFLGAAPPEEFAVVGQYAIGLVLAETGNREAARETLATLIQKSPAAIGETGLPLKPLAELRLLELERGGARPVTGPGLVSLDGFCSNAVYEPTLLTPRLLSAVSALAGPPEAEAEVAKWTTLWREQELSRELFRAVSGRVEEGLEAGEGSRAAAPERKGAMVSHLFWFSTLPNWDSFYTNGARVLAAGNWPGANPSEFESHNWLAVGVDDGTNLESFTCFAEPELGARLKALASGVGKIPDYFGIEIELAERAPWPVPDLRVWHMAYHWSRSGGIVAKEYADNSATKVLATAAQAEARKEQLRVNVYLTSPAALFERQRARTFWFGTLIAASSVAALVGLVAAYRSFHRQLRLSEMKSNFVSSVSHELRAPIASVRLMAESLERGKIGEERKRQEYFRFIVQECGRLSSLIENVLDFSRIEQGRKEYEFEPTDVVAMTHQTVKLMDTYATERQVKLALALDEAGLPNPIPQPVADGKALQQALINLIDNAIKHSPRGETVRVGLEMRSAERGARCGECETDSGRIALWVEDRGPGIPPEEHEKIFERFYRLGSELRRETQGVGIGLSIVKHVVEAHGGRVRVESKVGEGSRFTIDLPTNGRGVPGGAKIEN